MSDVVPIRYVIKVESWTECDCGCKDKRPVYHFTLPTGERVEEQVGDVYFTQPSGSGAEHAKWCPWINCDGMHLVVRMPEAPGGGWSYWNIDGRASNCTRADDRTHRCWVRHGDPRVPGQLHVDKSGDTCSAGAGSIALAHWHGFLHHGSLRRC